MIFPAITRWTAAGPVEVTHDLDELMDLHNLVERGPDWDTIIDIRITRHQPRHSGLTIEGAREL